MAASHDLCSCRLIDLILIVPGFRHQLIGLSRVAQELHGALPLGSRLIQQDDLELPGWCLRMHQHRFSKGGCQASQEENSVTLHLPSLLVQLACHR